MLFDSSLNRIVQIFLNSIFQSAKLLNYLKGLQVLVSQNDGGFEYNVPGATSIKLDNELIEIMCKDIREHQPQPARFFFLCNPTPPEPTPETKVFAIAIANLYINDLIRTASTTLKTCTAYFKNDIERISEVGSLHFRIKEFTKNTLTFAEIKITLYDYTLEKIRRKVLTAEKINADATYLMQKPPSYEGFFGACQVALLVDIPSRNTTAQARRPGAPEKRTRISADV